MKKELSSKSWSSASAGGSTVEIGSNNSLFIRDARSMDESVIFKPKMLGGSIEYDVNISGQECGCVAGVYLVDTDKGRCDEVAQNGTPQCKSVDAMQANLYGFESKANPCTNGTCDAISQCIVGMQ